MSKMGLHTFWTLTEHTLRSINNLREKCSEYMYTVYVYRYFRFIKMD